MSHTLVGSSGDYAEMMVLMNMNVNSKFRRAGESPISP